jgi:hypothetical protein
VREKPSQLFSVGCLTALVTLIALAVIVPGNRSSTSVVNNQEPTTTLIQLRPRFSATSIYAAHVSRGRQKWLSHGITNYRLVLKFFENFTRGRKSQREVIVKEGKVASSSCEHDECPAYVLMDVLTIEDLFGVARGSSIERLGINFDDCIKRIVFDDKYGFPTALAFECRNTYDMDHSVEVVSFEVLKDRPN